MTRPRRVALAATGAARSVRPLAEFGTLPALEAGVICERARAGDIDRRDSPEISQRIAAFARATPPF